MDKKHSKNKHIEQLDAIINYEVEKPYEEMDADLIEACVELSLELQEKNFTLSDEELEKKVRKIPFVDISDIKAIQQEKRRKINKKILLIAAIITILLAILAVFTVGHYVEDIHTVLKDTFGTVFNTPISEKLFINDDEITYNGLPGSYENIDEFCQKEKIAILFPDKLPNGIEFVKISITHSDKTIAACFSKEVTSYEICLDETIPQIIKDTADSYHTDSGLLCYIERMDDVGIVQVYFEHNGNYYLIGGTKEQILLDIIENLEEYK